MSLQNRTSEAIGERYPDGARLTVTEEVPFSSELRWSAIATSTDEGPSLLVLGAPEVIGPHLARGRDHSSLDRLVADKAGQGLRVVLFGRRAGEAPRLAPEDAAPDAKPTLPDGLEPLGVLVLSERIRPDARRHARPVR